MIVLDGDDSRLRSSSGQLAARDIVQFVPMRDFAAQPPQVLAKEVSVTLEVY
jgi:Copine